MSCGYAYGPIFCAALAWAWLDLGMDTGSIGKQSHWEDSLGFIQISLPLEFYKQHPQPFLRSLIFLKISLAITSAIFLPLHMATLDL